MSGGPTLTNGQQLDPTKTYNVVDNSGFGGVTPMGADEAASWSNWYQDNPMKQWGQSGPAYTSSAPQILRPGMPGFAASMTDVSFEGMVRAFQTHTINTRWPDLTPVAPDVQHGPAYLAWGAASEFFDDTPTDPVEDINADGYGMPVDSASGGFTTASAYTGASTDTNSTVSFSDGTSANMTLAQWWGANGYQQVNQNPGTNTYWTENPYTKTVTWYPTEGDATAARDSINAQNGATTVGSGGAGGTGGLLSGAGVQVRPQPTGVNSGAPGTTYAKVGAGQLVRPRPRQPQDRRPGVLAYDEIDRQSQVVIVYNPNDSEQWVAVERILSMRFRGPDGKIVKFNLKPPPPPPKPQDTST